jgi:hypothetical protein
MIRRGLICYNQHHGHTALAGKPPASRIPNPSGRD